MIPVPTGVRVWLATGHCDMRKGYASLSVLVQERLKHDSHGGHLFVFRGRRGDRLKIIWHDGYGACLFSKRLERGRFIWPTATDGAIAISPAQLGYMLEGSTGEDRSTPGGHRSPADGTRKSVGCCKVWRRRLFLRIIFKRMIAAGAKQFMVTA